jgi:hypothetical protein
MYVPLKEVALIVVIIVLIQWFIVPIGNDVADMVKMNSESLRMNHALVNVNGVNYRDGVIIE